MKKTRIEELKEKLKVLKKNKGKLRESARALIFKSLEGELKGRTETKAEIVKKIDKEWKAVCKAKKENAIIYAFQQIIKRKIMEV